MSSIMTNTSAMVALSTLKNINSNLSKTQSDISTGKSVATAKDNAAVWAISKVMESDVKGFTTISDSLALGQSTVAVASSASEKVTDLLTTMKQKITAAQESNVDRAKIQTDITALKNQIDSITGAAQFNGLNLLSNKKGAATVAQIVGNTGAGANVLGSGSIDILSSLDRSTTGVTASNITVRKADLGTSAHAAGAGTDIAAGAISASTAIAIGAQGTITIAGDTATAVRAGNKVLAGDTYTLGGLTGVTGSVEYVARDGDTVDDISAGLAAKLNFFAANSGVAITASAGSSGGTLTITNNTGAALTVTGAAKTAGTAGGGMELLSSFDVTTDNGASAALGAIESMIQTATKAAAAFGSSAGRIETQSDFVKSLTDSMKTGIGSLVDADMEEASARLQALQTQQQLGIQALSIANQQPQNILSLFK